MIKNSIIRKLTAILTLLISAVWLLAAACSKEPITEGPPTEKGHGITMTTLASEVSLYIEITKRTDSIVIIDWGDGQGNKTYMPSCEYSYCYLNVSHSYSGTSEHHITIIGENIDHLDCMGDFMTTGNLLTALDVSRYPALKSLRCGGNPLTTLDVSNNTALETLFCAGNLLSTLDVSRNTALKELYCHFNQLTTLDVSSNTELTRLYCDYNKLTALDVSNNKALRFLHCHYNQLTSSALNDLFRTLPDKPVLQVKQGPYPDFHFTIYIHENPGTSDCDVSIASEKGWHVHW